MSDPLEADPLAAAEEVAEPAVSNGVAETNGGSKKVVKKKKKKKGFVMKIGKKPKKGKAEPADNGADDGEYEVEAIVDHKKEKGRTLYRVRWKGYSPKSDTWLPANELNCKVILNKYKKKQEKVSKDVYEVEKIVDHRPHKGVRWYRLRWVGYTARDDTWQQEQLLSCANLIKQYNDERVSAILKREQEKAAAREKAEKKGGEYEVEAIMGKRASKKTGKTRYLIRWKGWDESGDTWEDADNLNCAELIKKYNASKKKPQAKKKGKRAYDSDEDSDDSDYESGGKRSKSEYEVMKVLNAKVNKEGKWEFFVMWKGYGSEECTWEPESNLNCAQLIDDFFGKNKIPKAVRNELEKTTTITAAKTAKQPRKPPAVRKEYRKERKERKTKAALKSF